MGKTEYMVYVDRRGAGNTESFTFEGRLLKDVLQKFVKWCMDEDETGIFFELENADVPLLMKDPHFHIVSVAEGDFGIVLKGLKIRQEGRNRYLLDMRAKRELLGISIDRMAELTGTADYKDRESGHRKVTIDEYERFMNVLEDIETEC